MALQMNKILFVDNDLHVLRSIKNELNDQADHWQLLSAESGAAALELLGKTPVEVVVCNFQMPGMSGLELLTLVENLYPQALRVMLTGNPGKTKYSQTANICHYFFVKPLHLEGFKRFLKRAAKVLTLLDNEQLVATLNTVDALPIHPDTFSKLTSCLDHHDIRSQQLARIASKDIALALQIFKLSCSANFSRSRGFDSLEEALVYLDLETIRSLLATQHLLFANNRDSCKSFKLNLLQRHSFQVIQLAETLTHLSGQQERLNEVRLAALLHDAGRIALAHTQAEAYREVFHRRDEQQLSSFTAAEIQVLGAGHAEVGAYLSALWGVPGCVVNAIRQHAQAQPPALNEAPISHLVWHANRLAQGQLGELPDYAQNLPEEAKWQRFFQQLGNSTEARP